MTDNEMNVAIANACGWKEVPFNTRPVVGECIEQKLFSFRPDEGLYCQWLPRYTTDLNAMNQAEMTLSDEEYSEWAYLLTQLRNDSCEECCRCRSATARQRAEAFLRVKGLWKEEVV